MSNFNFTFSDTIAGYVTKMDWEKDCFEMRTSDDRTFEVRLTPTLYAEMLRNLGEGYKSCDDVRNMLEEGKYIFVHGMFYPEEENQPRFDAKHIVFLGEDAEDYRFEDKDWWVKQIDKLSDFYYNAQFEDGKIDYRHYRTTVSLEGEAEEETYRQETDTISRLVYGFSSAYMLTGDERYLNAAEEGTNYLRDHMRAKTDGDQTHFWYHAIDVHGDKERKIYASEFGDDYDAIPAYEQIYALAGPTQTFRATGDRRIKEDIDKTINLFQKYYYDDKQGGYFTHVDPVKFSPLSEELGKNRSRKNWNSNGDHIPAYLINAWLATEEDKYREMLEYTADIIVDHFQDYSESPFVQERYHEDWSPDRTWGWQQNRAVVGHNLKIAWNLMRIDSLVHKDKYVTMAERIAGLMPKVGYDAQRGGWYDTLEREKPNDEKYYDFVWHDRKAWWQQEQGILAYMILNGTLKKDEYLKFARESTAFYNAWFLDTQNGGVYFNVLANGLPYLLGDQRLKGSHSQSGYHAFELAYLAAVYTNLLIRKQPMDFYFKPYPDSFEDGKLRVQPDILPNGSIMIDKVWINEEEYDNFDAKGLYVNLPNRDDRVTVKVRLMPSEGVENFCASIDTNEDTSTLSIFGKFDRYGLRRFKERMSSLISMRPKTLVLDVNYMTEMTDEAIRAFMFELSKFDMTEDVIIKGATDELKKRFEEDEITENIRFE